ncbi:AbfB domain-containing protein [Dactylosporangium sp. CA-233914]|uniref:AbfB domain-containing protein n=1 Tax=Dactylosporangium sp. CA-233914 TaxID=3239934 RepID=UPI003D90BDAF
MYGIGIDLGTSFVAAALIHDGTLDMVRLSGQAFAVPSVVYMDEQAGLMTGEPADRLSLEDPARAAREFKRRLGDPTPMVLAGAPHSPTALMAALLSDVLETVSQARQAPPDRIVLTHPAVWGPYRREQFAGVAPLAGLPSHLASSPASPPATDATTAPVPAVRLVTEPVAAATYYCSTRPLPPDGLLAVYDLGGGTFDSAVVRNGRAGLEIVGTPEGIEWLGGADFDQAVLSHVDQRLGGALSALDPADPRTAPILAAVLRDCTLAKEALSTREAAEVTVPLPGSPRQVGITRDTFEQMIGPSLDTTVEAFRRTLSAAGITPQDLTAVLLVGGSSPIPLVSQKLRDALGRPILSNTHPKHAVALGAAMLSAGGSPQRRAGARHRTAPVVPPVPAAAAPAAAEPHPASAAHPVSPPAPADPGSGAEPAVPAAEPNGTTEPNGTAGPNGTAEPSGPSGPAPRRSTRRRRGRLLLGLVTAGLAAVAVLLASTWPTQPSSDLEAAPPLPAAAPTSSVPKWAANSPELGGSPAPSSPDASGPAVAVGDATGPPKASSPAAATLQTGVYKSLRATTACCTNRYARHRDGLGYIDVVDANSTALLKQDATWRVVPGLADSSCYSFEARNFPDHYLRNQAFRVRMDANDNSAPFKADATWCAQPGNGGVRLTAWNFPGQYYLRHYNAELWLATPGGPNAYDSPTLFTEDTTWSLDAPWAP